MNYYQTVISVITVNMKCSNFASIFKIRKPKAVSEQKTKLFLKMMMVVVVLISLLLCAQKVSADGAATVKYIAADRPSCPSACHSAGYNIAIQVFSPKVSGLGSL